MKAWMIAFTCLGFTLVAHAQDAPQTPPASQAPSARQACRADYQKLCSGVPHSAARDCLNSHKADLSTACQEALAKAPPKDATSTPEQPPPKSQ
jgi:hypothetical protein